MSESAVLAGAPASISGFVPFHNTTSAAVTINEVVVDEADSSASLVVAVDPLVVAPDQRVRIEVRMQLPRQTPPGEYAVDVTVAGTEIPAVIYVVDDHTLGVTPDVLVVDNVAEATYVRTLVVANDGNVDLVIGDFDNLPVFAESEARTTLARMATTGLLDPTVKIAPLPTAVGTIEVGPASATAIPAGATTALELQIHLPEGLPQNARLVAGLPIGLRTVLVAVLPRGETKEDQ